jgi:hypothetical protein
MATERESHQESVVMARHPKLSPAPNSDLDDDLLDDDLPSDSAKMTFWMRIAYVALFLVVAGMVTYLILVILYPEQFAKPSWIGAAKPTKEAAASRSKLGGIALGGVVLGMTPADVKAIYPETRFEALPEVGMTGQFRHHDGDYQVWFHGAERGERAHRIRSTHVYPTVSYVELLSELADKYGQPDASNCGAEPGTVAIGCKVQWALPDAALDAQIRTAAPPAGAPTGTVAVTTLAVTATDLRPDAVFQRPALPSR